MPINRCGAALLGVAFPWSTLLVNVTGCLVMGLVAAWFAFRSGGEFSQNARLFLTTGILGGYTTFSAFSLDVALLWERGQALLSGLYVIGSVALSVLAVFAGLALIRMMN